MNPTQFDFATPPAVSLSVRAERAEAHKKQRGTDLDQVTALQKRLFQASLRAIIPPGHCFRRVEVPGTPKSQRAI